MFKFDDTFQPEQNCLELIDGTQTRSIALKKNDADVCVPTTQIWKLCNADTEKTLYITVYLQDLITIKMAMTNRAIVILKEIHNKLIRKNTIRFESEHFRE